MPKGAGSKSSKKNAEIWKSFPVKTLKDKYEISNEGRLRNKTTHYVLKPGKRSGYVSYMLNNNGKNCAYKIHIYVAKCFVANDNPEINKIVNHINGNKMDNRAVNLEWSNYQDNSKHAIATGLQKVTKRRVGKFDLKDNLIEEFDTVVGASTSIGVAESTIINGCKTGVPKKGYFWKYLDINPNEVEIDPEKEGFRQIDGYPNYWINSEGRVYSKPYKKFKKTNHNADKSCTIQLVHKGKKKQDFLIHRLTAQYFLPKKNAKHNSIRHKDGNKDNNNVDNLEWCYVPGVQMLESKC
jgi:hypothetical protein